MMSQETAHKEIDEKVIVCFNLNVTLLRQEANQRGSELA